jgi:predicted aminopeptidase
MKLRFGLAVSALLLASLSSCSLPFYWQAVSGQMELLRKRVPIAEVLSDPSTEQDLKASLRRVSEIRAFAVDTLLLPDNDSYTTYADLERPYVVWNVVAASELSVAPETWCFPFAGCVSYRGFFSRDNAIAFAEKLARDGFDTYVGGATAYSTLGYFDDPVLNTMLASDDIAIAALLFHELAHQKLYFKGDSELSEAFASVIEEHGTRSWLSLQGDTAGLALYMNRIAERREFADLVVAYRDRLGAIYAGSGTDSEKRVAKEQTFELLREDYTRAKSAGRLTDAYDAWFAQPLNNATLASVATYRLWVPGLRWRLETTGLDRFYSEVEALADLAGLERDALLREWNRLALAAGSSAKLRQSRFDPFELGQERFQAARLDSESR